jgi:FkbM family methyltransferase
MTFISYAQNFEDVLLWRALRSVEAGFYIDVGAADPDADSVTRALYDRGWSGVNIEPVAASAQRLLAARPRDVTLQVALGETPGRTEFFVVEGADTGLSTTVGAMVGQYDTARFDVGRTEVEVDTLAAVCRRHTPGPIHVLKVDVEGAERAVLAGADFAAFRPWIVLVEATAPMSTVETHLDWEGILLAAGYRFVWFDGLNRFYVAEERAADLAPHFRTPPNVFDGFVRAADAEWAMRFGQDAAHLRARAAEERADRLALRLTKEAARTAEQDQLHARRGQELLALQSRLDEAGRAQERLAAGLAEAVQRGDALAQRTDAMAHRAAVHKEETRAVRAWLAATRASTSWRVTAPLRRATALAGRLRGRAPQAAFENVPGDEVLGDEPPRTDELPHTDELPRVEDAALVEPPAPPVAPPVATPAATPASAPAPRHPRQPLRTVHQFHAGSATGDAITSAMLLTRRLLRQAGYRSDIFVEHRDPGLADELRLVEELPRHDAYVLVIRHSMGHRSLERLLALPAPKVLLYHNITPPEHLGHPALRASAREGREQLALLRPHVAAALADSEYNALELRSLGFDPVRACPLLVDPASLAGVAAAAGAHDAGRQPGVRPFTILFVGRIIESKGQLELIESFARFAQPFGGPARLVLVGRHGGAEDAYLESLFAAVRRNGLDGQVVLTGPLPDRDRDAWYAGADLYASLSHHEGFGVPLVEAMAHGVPVLAWPAGAVAGTLGGAAELVADPSPSAVAAQMLALARDPLRRAALAEAGRRALDRFAPGRHMPRLVEALVRAGAAAPPDPAARGTLAAAMRFAVVGHIAGTYSLAGVNRALAAAIEAERPGRVRVLPVEGQPQDDISRVPAPERDAVARLAGRTAPETGPEVMVSQHYPIYLPPNPGDLPLALTFWEESVMPAAMVAQLGRFRGVLAPSRFVAKVLADSGVVAPVRLLGQSPRLQPFQALAAARRDRVPGGPVTFLHVSSCFPRKGVDVLLAAYARAFRHGDAVLLVIKGHPNPHNDVAEQVARLQAADAGVAPMRYVGDDLDEAGLLALYASADVMVLPTRGEGYNLPAAEAMAAGLPLVVTGHGGHLDFCGPDEARLLDFEFAPSRSHLASPGSVWAEPGVEDLAAALREVAEQPGAARDRAARAQARIARDTDRSGMVDRLAGIALDLLLAPPAEPVRVAWISSWGVPCGVAEYSRHLVAHLPPEGLAEVVVLADMRTPDGAGAPAGAGADAGVDAGVDDERIGPRIRKDWQLGDPACVGRIAAALAVEDPHVVVVQHQPGLMAWPMLAALLRHPALAGRAAVITLHNTRHLLELDAGSLRATLDALGTAARVLVHTVADLNGLKRLGLLGNVALLPHGVPAPRLPRDVRTLAPADAALIGCYGFLLPGKGIPQLVAALALLRRRWPAARLRLVNAAYPAPEGEAELAACRAAITAAGLDDAVESVTGFLPHGRSADLLAECDLAVLPYQSSLEASSAALRTVMAAGVPVAVTPLPLFDEAGDAVLRLAGTDPASIAAGIADLLADPARRAAAAAAAHDWSLGRGWDGIGQRVAGMLRGLSANEAGRE